MTTDIWQNTGPINLTTVCANTYPNIGLFYDQIQQPQGSKQAGNTNEHTHIT